MKKILYAMMVLAMVFALSACGKGGNQEENPSGGPSSEAGAFRAGFARNDCMPDESVPLRGYGNVMMRMSDGYLDILQVSCIAITDETGNTALLLSTDMCGSSWCKEVRENISKELNVPMENIHLTATHTHSSIAYEKADSVSAVKNFMDKIKVVSLETARQAMEERKPAEMYWGVVDLDGYNFVRHYKLANGEIVGDNFGKDTGEYVGYSTEENHLMQVLQFKRAEGEKDIFFTNWRAHAHITGGSSKTNISADFPYTFRMNVEKQLDCYLAYYQGDSGNSNPYTRWAADGVDGVTYSGQITRDYKVYGKQIADIFVETYNKGFEKVGEGTGLIKAKMQVFTGDVNHEDDYLITDARVVQECWSTTGSSSSAMALDTTGKIRSVYHAGSICSKVNMPQTMDEEIFSLQIGEAGFVFVPNEIFVENGNFVRDNSPYKYQFYVGYSDDSKSYIPSQWGYDYKCYECCTGNYAPGTGEKLADTLVGMLKELKGN